MSEIWTSDVFQIITMSMVDCQRWEQKITNHVSGMDYRTWIVQIGEIVAHIGCGYGCIFVHIGVELELTIRSASEKLGWRQNSHSAEVNSSQNVTSRQRNRVEMHKPNYLWNSLKMWNISLFFSYYNFVYSHSLIPINRQ